MNLHGIASGAIGAVNAPVQLSVRVSTGYGADASFRQVPTYAPAAARRGQVQPLTWRDLQQLDGLNLQGTRVKIYVYGQLDGLVRATNRGGDLITVASGPYAGTWLVAQVLEGWQSAGWCSVAATLQNGS